MMIKRVTLALLVLLCGCVVETTESRRPLSGSGNNSGAPPLVIPHCELGQTLSEGGCRDIVVNDDSGTKVNLREVFAATKCSRVYGRMRAANNRTREYLGLPGHDLREGLRRVRAECQLRDEHIEACRSAGVFDRIGGSAGLAYLREGWASCYQLADLYRHRIADGYK